MDVFAAAAALAIENKSLAHPASVDSLPTSANQEVHVSIATFAARRLADLAGNSAGIVAIELLAAAQGIDLRAPLRTSPRLQEVHALVRSRVGFYDHDRYFAPDITAIQALVAVVGAHLSGMPLHHQLTACGARLRSATQTSPHYRLHALNGAQPPRPGLARSAQGAAIAVEVYDMPAEALGGFLAGIPAPLGLGSIELADGSWVNGFICEPWALDGAEDITAFGGWRNYMVAGHRKQA